MLFYCPFIQVALFERNGYKGSSCTWWGAESVCSHSGIEVRTSSSKAFNTLRRYCNQAFLRVCRPWSLRGRTCAHVFTQIWAEQAVENGKRDAAISFWLWIYFYNSSAIPRTSIGRMAGASPHNECTERSGNEWSGTFGKYCKWRRNRTN